VALIPEPLDAATGFPGALFGGFGPLLAAVPVFIFWRSRRARSAVVLRAVGEGAGAATEDLRGAGMADLGVSGLVAVFVDSALDLVAVELTLAFWAVAKPTRVAVATSKYASPCVVIPGFVMMISGSAFVLRALS
jgi:hypothetical protein